MKTKSLCTLACTLWCPFVLLAQINNVALQDSLALVEIYNTFSDGQTNLNWLNGPVDSWGDDPDEIIVAYEEGFQEARVVYINISGKGLNGSLDEAVNSLDALQQLRVSNNNISALPDTLNLSNLTTLSVSGNQLTSLPDLSNLGNLEVFHCASNQLTALPSLDQLTQLRIFNFTTNLITQLPNLSQLTALTDLTGQNNRLTSLPGLSNLINLQSLSICCNLLDSLPPSLSSLTNLEELSCYSNRLTELPPLDALVKLKELHCGNNKLDTLPGLSNLEELEFINCSRNYLKFEDIVPIVSLPDSIVYAPQANIPLFDFYITEGRDIHVDGYEEHNPLPSNEYKWVKGGGLVYSNDSLLFINNISKADSALFTLTVSNPNAPDLEITAPIKVHVWGENDAIPFDTTSLIVRRNALTQSIPTDSGTDTTNVKKCDCISDNLNLELIVDIPSIIEQNTIRMGSGSEVRKDTFDFNFTIDPGPIDTNLTCNIFLDYTPPSAPPTYDINVAVIGSGIGAHDDLLPYLYMIDSTDISPIGCISSGQLSWDFLKGSQNVQVNNSHETHIAGIIARKYPRNIDLNLIDLKVFDDSGYLFDLICAIQFAVEAGAEVINLSLGYNFETPSVPLYRALKYAEEAGVLAVISAGNENNNNDTINRWPGNFATMQPNNGNPLLKLSNLIVVAGLNEDQDALASFSNYGESTVHIAAPAFGTISTVMTPEGGSDYDAFSGTSMAAGEASRVASILKAYQEGLSPNRNIFTIIQSATAIDSTVIDTIEKSIMYDTKINLPEAISKLGLPNEEEILMEIDTTPYLTISYTKPAPIINGPHQSLDDIKLVIGDGSYIYENIDFRVIQIPVPPSGNPVYHQVCLYGNMIHWNGILEDGSAIDSSKGQYLIEIRVNGELVSVMPPQIRK